MRVNCDFCHIEFDKKIAEIKRTNHNFCCKKCRGGYFTNRDLDKKYIINPNTGCWEFTGFLNACGYGMVRYLGKLMSAHRISYILKHGDIPDSMCVLHKCDNPKCINPEHLFLGTHKDNMDDMLRKGRKPTKLTYDDVRVIRESTVSSYQLAKEYNVSPRAIRYAREPTHWQPLPAPPEH